MRKLFLIMYIIMSTFLFIGCKGEDGKDGSAYLKFSWDYYVDTWDDNNPDTPDQFIVIGIIILMQVLIHINTIVQIVR